MQEDIIVSALNKFFGFSEFRLGQKEVIDSILSGRDTIAVMPTGGGKSLCYQLPAILLEGTAIVVSPLIALMKDQVDQLNKIGVAAAFINSSLTLTQLQERVNLAISGEYKLLYVAPERLENEYFMRILSQMRISFLAIDEAHCISEWGHDFRPAYMKITDALKARPIRPIAAFTATAGPQVQEDIVNILDLKKCGRFIKGFDRPNLSYITIEDRNKIERLVDILKKTKYGSSIVYCGSRKKVDEYSFQLQKLGFDAAGYHAGLDQDKRRQVQDEFISGEKRIIVATNAFGMGIDKADVRNVIHCDFTSTLEAYYQEAGRAGRDTLPSNCYLIYHHSDIDLQEFFISCRFPERADMERMFSTLKYYADGYNHINLSPMLLANYASLPETKVSAILDIFEKNEIIERNNQPKRAKIKFTANRDRLIEYYQNTTKERRDIIAAIMRSLTAEVFERFMDIDLKKLLREHSLTEEQFDETIRALKFSSLAEYKPEKGQGNIAIISEVEAFSKLPIDLEGLKNRKIIAEKKLDVVIRYSETTQCKRNFILEYFQDDETKGECGKCSSCLSSTKTKAGNKKNEFIVNAILNGLWEIDNRFGKLLLIDFLRGVASEKTRKFKLAEFGNFGILNDQTDYDVRQGVEKAIAARLIKVSSGLYPILSLTRQGSAQISKTVKPVMLQLHESEQGEIFAKLKAARLDIAQKEGILERAVASDKALRLLAHNPPNNLTELQKTDGMSRFIVEKYGKLILAAIKDEIAEEYERVIVEAPDPVANKICQMFRDGYSIDEVAEALDLDKGSIARITQNAIMIGQIELNWSLFVSQKEYDKIKQTVFKKPHITLKSLRLVIIFDIDYAVLRIVTAIARKNL